MSVREITISTQPAVRADSGVALTTQPVVSVVDTKGNVIEGALVTARITTGDDKLSGTVTMETDADGKATFTDLVVSLPNHTNKLTFSSPGLTDSVETTGIAVT